MNVYQIPTVRLIPQDEAIRIWCETSGLECDPQAFKWWRIFVALKALAIWISSSEDFESGESKDSILAMAGWVMTDRQNRILLDYLAPGGAALPGATPCRSAQTATQSRVGHR